MLTGIITRFKANSKHKGVLTPFGRLKISSKKGMATPITGWRLKWGAVESSYSEVFSRGGI